MPSLDGAVLSWVVASRIDAATTLVAALSEFSRPAYLLIYSVVIAEVMVAVRRRRGWWVLPPAIAVTNALVHALKALIGRARPPAELQLAETSSDSFPSGHAAGAAVVALVVGALCARWWVRVALWVWALAVMYSRLYLGVHWLSDVVAGAVVGVAVGAAAIRLRVTLGERKVNERLTSH